MSEILSRPLVLVVEDEAALATMLRYNLEKQGFRVDEAGDGQEALTRISEVPPDLVLLDWMLPVMSGIEVCRQIRRRPDTRDLPVIMVTARTDDQDAVRGLNTGADDYITKPFNMEALLARMRALLRRAGGVPAKGTLTFHDVTLDQAAHRVHRNGRAVHLGPTEYRLLEFFLQHPRRVFSRKCWTPCGVPTSMSNRAPWTCISAACARRSTAKAKSTWSARYAPPATRWTPSRYNARRAGRLCLPGLAPDPFPVDQRLPGHQGKQPGERLGGAAIIEDNEPRLEAAREFVAKAQAGPFDRHALAVEDPVWHNWGIAEHRVDRPLQVQVEFDKAEPFLAEMLPAQFERDAVIGAAHHVGKCRGESGGGLGAIGHDGMGGRFGDIVFLDRPHEIAGPLRRAEDVIVAVPQIEVAAGNIRADGIEQRADPRMQVDFITEKVPAEMGGQQPERRIPGHGMRRPVPKRTK